MTDNTARTRARKTAEPAQERPESTDGDVQQQSAVVMHASLSEALSAFQAQMPTVHKGKTARVDMKGGGSYSYSYADLADISKAGMPLLAKHGLSFTSPPRFVDGQLMLVGTLRHTSGESDEGMLPISGGTPQALGSSITYMRRYLFGTMTGIVTDEDDDAAAAETQQREQARLEREHAERVERERAAAAEQRARDMQTATASADVVERLRVDVLHYADEISNPLARKESLIGVWNDAAREGALGCDVRVPDSWREATNGPETCPLHQLISGAADASLPPSGEAQPSADESDPWATEAAQS